MNFTQFVRHVRHTSDASEEHAEAMGKDCALNGPNTTNCHFSLFANPTLTRAWERGKRDGDKTKRATAVSKRSDRPRSAAKSPMKGFV